MLFSTVSYTHFNGNIIIYTLNIWNRVHNGRSEREGEMESEKKGERARERGGVETNRVKKE